ncbi:MAG: DUF3048 domain-containing protein [Lachnospiraceae bacterium]|jgi:hypothetical protein|nr:DUF3048 domain-containing protein [Lachnospiraceae bacterium]
MKRLKVLILTGIMSAALLCGCGANTASGVENNTTQEAKTEESGDTEEAKAEEFKREYNDKGQVRSFLTGKFVDKQIGERRPVGVMLSNIKDAQPMSGVGSADVVFEAPVEGEITRFLALFEDYDDLEKIGSCRSCRDYFLYWALEFDAVYCHYGQSSYAVEPLERDYVDNLSGLAAIGSTVYYRTDDRPSPHNAYCSAKGIKEGIKKMKYRENYRSTYAGKFQFAPDGETVSLEENRGTYIAPGYPINKPWFEYNKDDKLYYRYQYDGPQIDAETGEQLAFTNVILQYADWVQRDENGYLAFDCHDDGYAIIFTNGTLQEAHWIREGDEKTGTIRYYDIGLTHEITLNQGKTMVCVVKDKIGGEINPNVEFH